MRMREAVITHDGRMYKIAPAARTVFEIEEALGGICALAARLDRGDWTAGELVTLQHILLQCAGRDVDYMVLAEAMIARGLKKHVDEALGVLRAVLGDI
jgi:Phage tail tube protein, GTA-gp10